MINAIVFSNYPEDIYESEFRPKLKSLGVNVLRVYKPDHVSGDLVNVEQADVIVRFIGLMSHSQDEAIKKRARQYDKPMVVLQRQTSGWQQAFEPVMLARSRETAREPARVPVLVSELAAPVKHVMHTFMALTKSGVAEDEVLQALQAMLPVDGLECQNLGLVESFFERHVDRAPDEFRSWWREYKKASLAPLSAPDVPLSTSTDMPVSAPAMPVEDGLSDSTKQVLQFIRQLTTAGQATHGRAHLVTALHLSEKRVNHMVAELLTRRLIKDVPERRGNGPDRPTFWACPTATYTPPERVESKSSPVVSSDLQRQLDETLAALDDAHTIESIYEEETKQVRAELEERRQALKRVQHSLDNTLKAFTAMTGSHAAERQKQRREVERLKKELESTRQTVEALRGKVAKAEERAAKAEERAAPATSSRLDAAVTAFKSLLQLGIMTREEVGRKLVEQLFDE